VKTRRMRGFLPAASLLLLGALAYPSSAPGQAAEAVLDLLHPGSRSSLGLGGDPFLSPLDDEVGWWARARTITGGEVRLDVRDYAPLPEHANSQRGALYARRTRVSVSRRLPYGTRSVALTARIESPSTALSVGQADGSLRMSSSGSVAQGYLRLMDLWPGATHRACLGMGVPVTAAYLITAVLAVPAMSSMLVTAWRPGVSAGRAGPIRPESLAGILCLRSALHPIRRRADRGLDRSGAPFDDRQTQRRR